MDQFVQALPSAPVRNGGSAHDSLRRDAAPDRSNVDQDDRGTIRVLVCDGTRMGLQLLEQALDRTDYGFRIVATTTESSRAVEAAETGHPHVALVNADLQDGPQKGLKAIRELRAQHPGVRSVLLIDSQDRDLILEAFRSGAKGVCARDESLDNLRKCIYSVYHGQVWANSCQLQIVLEALVASSPVRLVNVQGKKLLTDREEQVAYLVAEGLTNREISERMHLSEHTVKNYLFRIFDKLGISNRVELILYTLQQRNRAA